jgi:hypothetical protein
MEHGRELGSDDELATPRRRPTEIAGTGLEGTLLKAPERTIRKEGSANALCKPA